MKKDVKKPKSKTKQKQKQKQKQSVVININSNNRRPKKEAPITSKPSSGAPNIPNVQPPQYITRGMPPTINNTPPAPVPDMGKILSHMAEMNSNFSGIGGLNSVIKGLNDKQSALESRLTQQYGLQNDFNNEQVHFNNQARQFFTENAYVAPLPSAPPMFVGGGVYQQPVLNPFQKPADDVSSIQSNPFSNDEFNFDDISEFTDNTENENLIEEIRNSMANDAETPAFQPQTNVQPIVEKDPAEEQRILDVQNQLQEQRDQERLLAREEAIRRKADAQILKEQEAEAKHLADEKQAQEDVALNAKYDTQLAEINAEKQKNYETYAQTSERLMTLYNGSYDAFLKDYTEFTESENVGKLSAHEKQLYNKLSLNKNRSNNISRATALSNIQNNTNLNTFIAKNTAHSAEPTTFGSGGTGSLLNQPVDGNAKAGAEGVKFGD